MSRVVILHGMPGEDEYFGDVYPSASNSHWIPWLQKQMLMRGHDVQTPEVVNSHRPHYGTWRSEFERHVADDPMILVGHSCGGGFLLRWLSDNSDVVVDKLALVAPWLDPDRTDTTDFFDFEIDETLNTRVKRLHLFESTDDSASIQTSVAIIKERLHVIEHAYDNMGHFCLKDMKTDAFPALLDALTTD